MHHLHLTASYLGKTDQTVVMIKTKKHEHEGHLAVSQVVRKISVSVTVKISSKDYPHLDDLIVL